MRIKIAPLTAGVISEGVLPARLTLMIRLPCGPGHRTGTTS
jgi:hypothetical protein